MHKCSTLILLLLMFFLAACAQPEPTPTPRIEPTMANTPTPTATAIPPTAEPSATALPPTKTPTPELTATPIVVIPVIGAGDQTVTDNGQISINQVISDGPGWIGLLSDGVLLAQSAVADGLTESITFDVDPLALMPTVDIQLFTGEPGDTTAPTLFNDEPVVTTIGVTLEITTPQLTVNDQAVAESGVVRVNNVVTRGDSWLAVYADDNGALGRQLGLQWVPTGVFEEIPIPIVWRDGTPHLHVVMHADFGAPGSFDAENDAIVMMAQQPIQQTFSATYPPEIFVFDQPVINNTIVIERVISNGPGWLAILFEAAEDQPGNIFGFAPLQDGVNEQVVVELTPGLTTINLYAQIHTDTGDIGIFEFPAGDAPVLHNNQVTPFRFRTDAGNYIISADQQIVNNTVTMPLVVGDLQMWVAIRTDVEGRPGDVIGTVLVEPGISRNVIIEVDAEQATPILHAVLHIDRDGIGVFEFPDGRDFELQRRFAPIDAPFFVIP